jgi:uncharacterized membrane protein
VRIKEEIIEIFLVIISLATFLCTLVAGLLFAFAVVVMPGIRNLSDAEFIRAFQAMDRIIQNNQPIFILVWVGSAVFLIATAVLGFGQLDGTDLLLLIFAALTYLLGVQIPTVIINIPLNNELQTLNVDSLSENAQKLARQEFESRWNKWNLIRTILSSLASAILIILLLTF